VQHEVAVYNLQTRVSVVRMRHQVRLHYNPHRSLCSSMRGWVVTGGAGAAPEHRDEGGTAAGAVPGPRQRLGRLDRARAPAALARARPSSPGHAAGAAPPQHAPGRLFGVVRQPAPCAVGPDDGRAAIPRRLPPREFPVYVRAGVRQNDRPALV
jgi:hypothetical protein